MCFLIFISNASPTSCCRLIGSFLPALVAVEEPRERILFLLHQGGIPLQTLQQILQVSSRIIDDHIVCSYFVLITIHGWFPLYFLCQFFLFSYTGRYWPSTWNDAFCIPNSSLWKMIFIELHLREDLEMGRIFVLKGFFYVSENFFEINYNIEIIVSWCMVWFNRYILKDNFLWKHCSNVKSAIPINK